MVIWFYSKTPEYGWLSNFSEHPIVLDGVRWPSVEHFYQAQKYVDTAQVAESIRGMASPSQVRTAGRDRSLTVRPDWDAVKEDVMRQAVRAKFTQHVVLQKLLLATEDNELVHESDDDEFLGASAEWNWSKSSGFDPHANSLAVARRPRRTGKKNSPVCDFPPPPRRHSHSGGRFAAVPTVSR